MQSVIQEVTHDEPAAEVPEVEAMEILDEQYAQHVEEQLHRGQASGTCDSMEADDETVYKLTYSHHPLEFLQALMEGPALQQCRNALAEAGYSSLLRETGAKIFVKPHQWQIVMQALQGHDLHPYHVIVTEGFEHLVAESLLSIRCKKRPKIKAGGRLPLVQPKHEDNEIAKNNSFQTGGTDHCAESDVFEDLLGHAEFDVQRTFLCSVPRQREAASVTQSTTSHYEDPVHGPRNPRRRDPKLLLPLM